VADQAVDRYLLLLGRIREQPEANPELSLREPLLELLRAFGDAAGRRGLMVAPEASAGDVGQPDIFIKDGPRLIGFAETKAPGAPLARLLRTSTQLKRYSESLPNWILTDYYLFVFIENGEVGPPIDIRAEPEAVRGRMPIDLPGWDYYSIWGWDDQEASLFAQLWRNTDDGGEEPRYWVSSVVGWPVTGLPEVLAGWIAQVTGSDPRDVLHALACGAPDLVAAELRELAAA
jgi:hypothetical protein